jgi:hypothetical protein
MFLAHLASSNPCGMSQGENIVHSLFPFFAYISLNRGLSLIRLFQAFYEAASQLEPLSATLLHKQYLTSLFLRGLILIAETGLALSLVLVNARYVRVAYEDPWRIFRLVCSGWGQAMKKIVNCFSQLPCIWNSRVWVMKVRAVKYSTLGAYWLT